MTTRTDTLVFDNRLTFLRTGAPTKLLDEDLILAVGFLIGAGAPNAAAAVAYAAECSDRDTLWPWQKREPTA